MPAAQRKPKGKRQPVKSGSGLPTAVEPTAFERLGEPPPSAKLRVRPEQDIASGEVISVDTTEILLPVTVRDSEGRLVNNLGRQDFRVFEDSSGQPLSDLALRQVPVDAVLRSMLHRVWPAIWTILTESIIL